MQKEGAIEVPNSRTPGAHNLGSGNGTQVVALDLPLLDTASTSHSEFFPPDLSDFSSVSSTADRSNNYSPPVAFKRRSLCRVQPSLSRVCGRVSKRHATRQSPHRLIVPTSSLHADGIRDAGPVVGSMFPLSQMRHHVVQLRFCPGLTQVVCRRLSPCSSDRISLGRFLTGAGALQAEIVTTVLLPRIRASQARYLPRRGLATKDVKR
ncbi:hypothetical protein QBC45DRAFT_113551 [Copromyces sp. CBS 386.78]|nr:hypothetical protein QBC45DRAFT_113551 [Copromyces sp. CBS 386.78]